MTALVIANTQIRRDAAGRYCLNDLHQASGGAEKNQPNRWLRLQQTQELVTQISEPAPEVAAPPPDLAAVATVNEGFGAGTYAVKELVYAYAMWISAAFHLHVIRAYDAMVTARPAEPPALLAQPQHRADQLVSAGRIFSAALRTARGLRLPPQRAMRAAFDCARKHTGINWQDELQASDVLETPGPHAPRSNNVCGFHAAWSAGECGLPYVTALSTDVYLAYQRWCGARGERPEVLRIFVQDIKAEAQVRVERRRWMDGGHVAGPNSCIVLEGDQASGEADERERISRSLHTFRSALQTAGAANA